MEKTVLRKITWKVAPYVCRNCTDYPYKSATFPKAEENREQIGQNFDLELDLN